MYTLLEALDYGDKFILNENEYIKLKIPNMAIFEANESDIKGRFGVRWDAIDALWSKSMVADLESGLIEIFSDDTKVLKMNLTEYNTIDQ